MVSIAAFGPGDPGSNPGWFAVSNANKKLSFYKYHHIYSRQHRNPAIRGILVGIDK